MTSLSDVRHMLDKLISFDTTSRHSNLDIIDWIESFLTPLGASCIRVPNSSGTKANLWARLGPEVPGGIVLSGHTDVVPVDGQDWHTDPFKLTEGTDGLLYGRGTCDMKGFLALCLAFAPSFAKKALKKPIHFAFSYDEEVGCQGAPSMIEEIVKQGASPEAVWVGEPTEWQVISGHKGIALTAVEVTGHEAHSSLPEMGLSAIGEAVDLMAILRKIQQDLIESAPDDTPFEPPYPTLTIGEVSGGTATNILARKCRFAFDLRCPPGYDVEGVLAPFYDAVDAANQRIRDRFPECGIDVDQMTNVPPLNVAPESPAETMMRALTGDNAVRAVAYATEAGQFATAGIPSVVCGPGSIDQAHKPNEFIDPAQLSHGVEIFKRLTERWAG
ncbi:MAG: acetylornithine deacetylase [Pseudomonadota bacterium]